MTGAGGVPTTGVLAVALNVITTSSSTTGAPVAVWANGETRPTSTVLLTSSAATVNNTVVAEVGADGAVSVWLGSGTSQIIVDVQGYVTSQDAASAGSLFSPLALTRVVDTRSGMGGTTGPVGAAASFNVQITGVAGVPADATSVALNITGVAPTANTYISAYATGGAQAGSVNVASGATTAEMLFVPIGTGGKIQLRNNAGSVQILADVEGYFRNSGDGTNYYVPLQGRLVDTRSAYGGLGPIGAGASSARKIPVLGVAGVPASGVTAVVVSVAALNPTSNTYLNIYKTGASAPTGSLLNVPSGGKTSNTAIVELGTDPAGQITLSNFAGTVDAIVDIQGYFAPVTAPSPPQQVTAVAGSGQATLTWQVPDDPGGVAPTYTVTSVPAGATTTTSATGATLTGLTNGTRYRFTVQASNPEGTSSSATSNSVVPGSASGADVGEVSTLAGDGGSSSHAGTGTGAGLAAPSSVATVGDWAYVTTADAVMKVSRSTGAASVLAGSLGASAACTDGTSTAARFKPATWVAADSTTLYTVSDCGLRATRLSDGQTSTITVTGFPALTTKVVSITAPGDGYLYASVNGSNSIMKINPSTGSGAVYASVAPPHYYSASVKSVTSSGGVLYLLATESSTTTVVDEHLYQVPLSTGVAALVQDTYLTSRLSITAGLQAVGTVVYARADLTLCVGSCVTPPVYGPRLVGIDTATGEVIGVAGSSSGYVDGVGPGAWFRDLAGLAADGTTGALLVADSGNNRLRRVTMTNPDPVGVPDWTNDAGSVTTGDVKNLAGGSTSTSMAGVGSAAGFNTPTSIVFQNGLLYVGTADTIMTVDPATGQASILAGAAGSPGAVDATTGGQARVTNVRDLVSDGSHLYFLQDQYVRRLDPATGAIATVAAGFVSLTIAGNGVLYGLAVGNDIDAIDPATGATTKLVSVSTTFCGSGNGVIQQITGDAESVWVLGTTDQCGDWPRLIGYSVDDGHLSFDQAVSDPRGGRAYMSARPDIASIGDSIYVAYPVENDAPTPVQCWPTDVFAVNKITRTTSLIAGSTTMASPCVAPNDVEGVGAAAAFSNISEITSDGHALYTVGSAANNNRVRVIVPAPIPAEYVGGGNPAENTDCSRCVGYPVDLDTGAMFESAQDMLISGRGPGIDFTRTYDTRNASTGGRLGYGWVDSYNWSLTTSGSGTGSTATITQGNGSRTVFTQQADGTYSAPARILAALIHNGDGTWTYTLRKATKFAFTSGGRLTKVSDLNGYKTTLGYDGSNRLSTVTDNANRVMTLTYDTSNRIKTLSNTYPQTVTFTYDTAGNLWKVSDRDGRTWTYTYDSAHRLTGIQDPRLNTVTTHYNAAGQVDWQRDRRNKETDFTYSATNAAGYHTTTVQHPAGNTDVYTYHLGMAIKTVKASGTALAATWRYEYDPQTRATTSITDPTNRVVRTKVDDDGNPKKITDPAGRTTKLTYNDLGEVLTSTDPMNITTTSTYDARGNLLSISKPLDSSTNQVTTYVHGDATNPGDVTSILDPRGKSTDYTYDTYGYTATVKDPTGRKSSFSHNMLGWLTATITPAGNVTGATAAQYTITYDNFTGYGQPKKVTDQLGHISTYNYDGDQNLTDIQDADLKTTHLVYNEENQPLSTEQPTGTQINATTYDDNGNVASQTNDITLPSTTYTYDALGRLSKVSDPLNRDTTYGYDLAGRPTTVTTPATPTGTQTATTSYNIAGMVTGIDYSSPTTPDVAYTYDDDGHRLTMTDATGTTTYTYDNLGRLTATSNPLTGTVGYTYDLADRVTTLTYPGTHNVIRGYDDAGRLTSVKDWINTNPATFGYDNDGNWNATSYPNTVTATRTHDTTGALTGLTYTKGAATLGTLNYTRTDAGLLKTTTPTAGAPGTSDTYTYNARDQLTSRDGGTTNYIYDAAGRLTRTSNGSTLAYDSGDQLTTATPAAGAATSYTFDRRGERTISQVAGAPTATTYAFDEAGHLTTYTPNGGPATSYTLDGDGTRAASTTSGIGHAWTWDRATGGLPLLLADGIRCYLYGPGDTPLGQIYGTASTWLHGDQHASTVLATDTTGVVTGTWSYDPYGDISSHTGTATTNLLYAGQYQDAESGQYYLRAREYDPATGSFLTVDPIVATTRSRYAYGSGDPGNRTDPSGLVTLGRCLGLGIGGVTYFAASLCTVRDDQGNIGVAISGGDGAASPAVGVGASVLASDATTVWDLQGQDYFGGGSVAPFSEGPDIGAQYSWGQDDCGRNVHTAELGAGMGLELVPFGEGHGGISVTKVYGVHVPGILDNPVGHLLLMIL